MQHTSTNIITKENGAGSDTINISAATDLTNGKLIVIDFICLAGSTSVDEFQSIAVTNTNSGLLLFKAQNSVAANEANTIFIEFANGLPAYSMGDLAGTYISNGVRGPVTITGLAETIDALTVGYHYETAR